MINIIRYFHSLVINDIISVPNAQWWNFRSHSICKCACVPKTMK